MVKLSSTSLSQLKLEEMVQAVYDELGADHKEEIYKHAMLVELRLNGFRYDCEQPVEVRYKNNHVGWGFADIIVRLGDSEDVLIELKQGEKVNKAQLQQARNYMRQLGIEAGYVVNFPGFGKAQLDEDVDSQAEKQPGKRSKKPRKMIATAVKVD